MEFEEQILDEVWKGCIPIRISLSTYDIASHEIPPDYYCLIPRNNYLPQLLEAVKLHFEPYTPTDFTLESIWFSYNSNPLKWHYPIGFLADIHSSIESGSLLLLIPFHLEAHFHRYPTEILLPYHGLKSIRSIYQNSLKESCALLLGTSASVMNLSRDKEDLMWKSATQGDYRAFKDIGNDFVRIPRLDCRNLPVRIFYSKLGNGTILHPFHANSNTTVGDAIKEISPLFTGKIVIQGVIISSFADLYWLWKYMSNPDNFLYIVLLD